MKEPQEISETLIIAGMHRSGTSLVTQWLHACGLQVGEQLLPAHNSNAKGHFEDVEFLHMHEQVLRDNNLCDTGLESPRVLQISIYNKARISAVLSVKAKLFKQWGWKEPRTCLLLNTYRELLPSAKYLIVLRDYNAVVNSLLKRGFGYIDEKYLSRKWLSRQIWTRFRRQKHLKRYKRENAPKFLKAWIIYNKAILDALADLQRNQYLVVNYEMLKTTDRQVFDILKNDWGFELTYQNFNSIYEESLISEQADIMTYIEDKALIQEANKIFNDLNFYLQE